MRSTSTLRFQPLSNANTTPRSACNSPRSRLSTSLTLAAMSVGFGVVQLDVTIVNTALNSIGAALGGGVAELQWVVNSYTIDPSNRQRAGCRAVRLAGRSCKRFHGRRA